MGADMSNVQATRGRLRERRDGGGGSERILRATTEEAKGRRNGAEAASDMSVVPKAHQSALWTQATR